MIKQLTFYIKCISGFCLLGILALYAFNQYQNYQLKNDPFKALFFLKHGSASFYIEDTFKNIFISFSDSIPDEVRVFMPLFKKQINSYVVFKTVNKKLDNLGCFKPQEITQRLISFDKTECFFSGIFSLRSKVYKDQTLQTYFSKDSIFFKQNKTLYIFNYFLFKKENVSIAFLPLTNSQIKKNENILISNKKLYGTACIFTKQKLFMFDPLTQSYKQKMVSDVIGNHQFVDLTDICLLN